MNYINIYNDDDDDNDDDIGSKNMKIKYMYTCIFQPNEYNFTSCT